MSYVRMNHPVPAAVTQPPVILFRLLPADRGSIQRIPSRMATIQAISSGALDAQARATPIGGIVYDVSLVDPYQGVNALAAFAIASDVPLVLRLRPKREDVRVLMEFGRIDVDWRVSVVGLDAPAVSISRLVSGVRPEDACRQIVQSVATYCPPRIQETVVAMAIVARRRLLASQFASSWEQPLRTMELHAATVGLPGISILLGWILAIHAGYRLEILEWPVKRASREAGFASCEAFASYMQRHVGLRPAAMKAPGTFASLLHEFSDLIAGCVTAARGARTGRTPVGRAGRDALLA